MNISISYTNELMTNIEQFSDEAIQWYDLRASKDIKIREGEFAKIPIGIIIDIPDGYEGNIILRKGVAEKYGIILPSGMEVIAGNEEVFITVYAIKDTKINFNDRICQLKIVNCQENINFD